MDHPKRHLFRSWRFLSLAFLLFFGDVSCFACEDLGEGQKGECRLSREKALRRPSHGSTHEGGDTFSQLSKEQPGVTDGKVAPVKPPRRKPTSGKDSLETPPSLENLHLEKENVSAPLSKGKESVDKEEDEEEEEKSEYFLAADGKIEEEVERLTPEEEDTLLMTAFSNPHDFLKLLKSCLSPLKVKCASQLTALSFEGKEAPVVDGWKKYSSQLTVSSVVKGNPSFFDILYESNVGQHTTLMKISFIQTYSGSPYENMGQLNSSMSISTFFRMAVSPTDEAFIGFFLKMVDNLSDPKTRQLYTALDLRENGVRKMIVRRPAEDDAISLEYYPSALTH